MPEENDTGGCRESVKVSELEGYLRTGVRPHVMPSTFAILNREFRKLKEQGLDADAIINGLLAFFEKSNPSLHRRLQEFYAVPFTEEKPPADGGGDAVATGVAETREKIGEQEGFPGAEFLAGCVSRTLAAEELERLQLMDTLRPPAPGPLPEQAPASEAAVISTRDADVVLLDSGTGEGAADLRKTLRRKKTPPELPAAPKAAAPQAKHPVQEMRQVDPGEVEDPDICDRPTLTSCVPDGRTPKPSAAAKAPGQASSGKGLGLNEVEESWFSGGGGSPGKRD